MDAVLACSSGTPSSDKPLGMGDHLIVDVEASAAPPTPADDAGGDSPFAPVGTVSTAAYMDSGSLVLTVCGPPEAGAGGDAAKKDASEPAATEGDDASASGDASGGLYGGGSSSSCVAFPSSCASQPDCDCLLGVVSAQLPCSYPHCALVMGSFAMYCPQ